MEENHLKLVCLTFFFTQWVSGFFANPNLSYENSEIFLFFRRWIGVSSPKESHMSLSRFKGSFEYLGWLDRLLESVRKSGLIRKGDRGLFRRAAWIRGTNVV